MLKYKNRKFYVDGKEASENSGACIDCSQATIVVKGGGKEYRVGCACRGGVDFGALTRGEFVKVK